MTTIPEAIFRHARRLPDREAMVFGPQRWTYAELDAAINRYAYVLGSRGLQKGDRLALMSPNRPEFVFTFYAALRLGLLVVPVNPRMAPPEVTYLLDDSGARAFVFDPALTEVALAGHAAAASPPGVLYASRSGTDEADLSATAAGASAEPPQVVVDGDDDAEILYTSGTTGLPKGVLLDHHRITWDAVNIDLSVGIADGASLLHVAPLYHSAELNLFLNGGMLVGAKHVLLAEFDPGAVLEAMESERISAFFGVPTMYQFLLAHPSFATRDLSGWEIGMFGAAPMPPSLIEKLAAAVPDVRLYNLCGPTEAGPGGIMLGPEHMLERPGANGWAVLNTEARVVDDDGVDVGPGEVGEILLRGVTIMKEYWNKPEATAEALRDGWLHTGDVARIDADGCITVVDRKKDMIISGGMNVYSVEVENALASHPDVADVAVIGVPHDTYGESILAVVTPAEGTEPTLDELRSHAMRSVADYKAPHQLVLGPIPRNPSGKIVKHELRDTIEAQP